jgi:hypothetical protein
MSETDHLNPAPEDPESVQGQEVYEEGAADASADPELGEGAAAVDEATLERTDTRKTELKKVKIRKKHATESKRSSDMVARIAVVSGGALTGMGILELFRHHESLQIMLHMAMPLYVGGPLFLLGLWQLCTKDSVVLSVLGHACLLISLTGLVDFTMKGTYAILDTKGAWAIALPFVEAGFCLIHFIASVYQLIRVACCSNGKKKEKDKKGYEKTA